MRSTLSVAIALVSGCVFEPPSAQGPDDAAVARDKNDDETSDAHEEIDARASDANANEDAASPCPGERPSPPFCDPNDPNLRACFTFDDFFVDASNQLIIRDGSSFSNMGTVSSGTVTAGFDGRSLALDGSGEMWIALDPSLDLDRLTVEAWIRADVLPPSGERAGIADKNGSWGLFLEPDGTFQCTAGGLAARGGQAPTGAWFHAACTYDGATLIAHQDGASIVETSSGSAIEVGTTDPIAIGANSPSGDRLRGQIDRLRIFAEPLGANALCWDANL